MSLEYTQDHGDGTENNNNHGHPDHARTNSEAAQTNRADKDIVDGFLNCGFLLEAGRHGAGEGAAAADEPWSDYRRALLIQQLKEFRQLYHEYVNQRIKEMQDNTDNMKSGSIQSVLNQSHIVDDFTSDYYETISSKMHQVGTTTNGSEFRSSYRLRSIRSRIEGTARHHSPTRSQNYGGAVKRVKVDLVSPRSRLPSAASNNYNNNMHRNFDYMSYANSSNIIDDFDSQVDEEEGFREDNGQPTRILIQSPPNEHEHDLPSDLKVELKIEIPQSPKNSDVTRR